MSDSLDRREILLAHGYVDLGRASSEDIFFVNPATCDIAHRLTVAGDDAWLYTHYGLDRIFDVILTCLHFELHRSDVPPAHFRGKNCYQVAIEKMTELFPQWKNKE